MTHGVVFDLAVFNAEASAGRGATWLGRFLQATGACAPCDFHPAPILGSKSPTR